MGGLPTTKLIPVHGTESRIISHGNKKSAYKESREKMNDYDEEVRKYERRGQEILAKKSPSVVRKKKCKTSSSYKPATIIYRIW